MTNSKKKKELVLPKKQFVKYFSASPNASGCGHIIEYAIFWFLGTIGLGMMCWGSWGLFVFISYMTKPGAFDNIAPQEWVTTLALSLPMFLLPIIVFVGTVWSRQTRKRKQANQANNQILILQDKDDWFVIKESS